MRYSTCRAALGVPVVLCASSILVRVMMSVMFSLNIQVDKSWSAVAKRPYDPFLSDHGQDQVCRSSKHAIPSAVHQLTCAKFIQFAGQKSCCKVEEV